MSSDGPLEFFFDHSLSKRTAAALRSHGAIVHLIADHYPDDATMVADEVWIEAGCRRGWCLLTKDKRIRYREAELAALNGYLFCLAAGSAKVELMSERLIAALPSISRAVLRGTPGFWHAYADGTIRKMWP